MDGTADHCVQRNKPDSESTACFPSYVESL